MSAALRPARPGDAEPTGDILYRFAQDTPWMPKLYQRDETVGFCGVMIARGWVTVVVLGGQVAGFIARDGQEICSLYLANAAQGQGLGTALLADAMGQSDRLELWTFQRNTGAQRFYARHGFVEAARTDGAGNEERLPDIRYEWRRS
ncbi:GNAT family N-acetyltransferase [Ruegeria pomeroyi]|uniref:Acetyltransferase, GNAT family n=2 Tax=Ruegeria pomeroyi TaxID=89184 RepID=Q5LNR2_RUEPO|nr:GNAT family N-acetyltransferase [Ruegeria pomeroyi]AAV96376.1 acetyltransferase, GNAT family [Ruegeria pomeroyi DSS-3]NVK98359.1 GNAT family N-acetyltransferase [Ruegeria pomeroyi]NVL00906.1 GNAT family N-acetyltransferase [Ruegeria pomeroyi]QWV09923.1 GNAT family N-acetyltransferase [Ruegeria pomeroyi]